jgi:sporulation protein YlmC with PRC-barrel domain
METLDENAGVISASKVTGTNVYNIEGDLLGEIHDVMLDKRSGRIAYAIMSFGGFLGIGEQ